MKDLDVYSLGLGRSHAALITADGDVYTWGKGDQGQLGLGSGASIEVPQWVSALDGKPVAQVWNHHLV